MCSQLTAFVTSILLSYSVALYIAACILHAGFNWPHAFWTKTNKIYKRETWRVCKKASPILDLQTSTSNIPKNTEKNRQIVKEMREKKGKKIEVEGAVSLHANAKGCYDFWKHLYFKNVYSTGALSQLISALISEATIPEFNERYFWIWKNIYKGIN